MGRGFLKVQSTVRLAVDFWVSAVDHEGDAPFVEALVKE